jgi:hypothetical protein
MRRLVRPTVGKLLAATRLALNIGPRLLEASRRRDRVLKDANDEASKAAAAKTASLVDLNTASKFRPRCKTRNWRRKGRLS